ncbi:MAG: hypothetical protein P3B98_08840 [Gemmatimonadota bacterium]|nr:hypothetical protein [Gemmatimonadota bacterium]
MRGNSAVAAILLTLGLTACVSSEQPFVTARDAHFAPELVGQWSDSAARERAVITRAGPAAYAVAYTDERGEARRYVGRLGRLGSYFLLDLEQAEPSPSDSASGGGHVPLVLETIAPRLSFALLDPDSLKAYLQANPRAIAHRKTKDEIVFTAGSAELSAFLAGYLRRPGVLSERSVWVRRSP